MLSIPLYLSQQHACGYFDKRLAKSEFIHPAVKLTPALYARLLEHGFRRSGNQVYRPHCTHCSDCIAIRLPVAEFRPTRIQKRIQKKNRQLTTHIKPALFDPAHFDLYLKYQHVRHADGSMASSSPEDYMQFLGSDWCDTVFVEFLASGKLAAVAVIDRLPSAYSAVYTFFDPELSALSLGSYAVLWQIQQLQSYSLPWLYLGFWLKDCRKMAYKDQYRPIQALLNGAWQEFFKGQKIT